MTMSDEDEANELPSVEAEVELTNDLLSKVGSFVDVDKCDRRGLYHYIRTLCESMIEAGLGEDDSEP